MDFFNQFNTEGYSDADLRALNRAVMRRFNKLPKPDRAHIRADTNARKHFVASVQMDWDTENPAP